MDLSVNKVKQSKQLSFKGMKGDFEPNNEKVFRFFAPSYNHKETPYLELFTLEREKNANKVVDSNNYIPELEYEYDFEGSNTIAIPQADFEESGIKAFAYRYRFEHKNEDGEIEYRYATDATKKTKIDGKEYNIVEIGDNYGVTPEGGSMYHALIDSVGYYLGKIEDGVADFIRTHANKLGGTIKGMIYLLKNGFFNAYKYIISTPDIGADPTSPHGYWPNNQYQCNNMKDFKDFNFELFKEGKGYVADGAFTSQSLQSPFVQHVLKWGEQSPFYHMLKVNDKMQLGVLPENKEALENVGIKLINPPKSDTYDKNKPTYIQFVDDRLVDYDQKHDTEKPITKYAIPNPEDHYDIVDYQDTIHPFYFEIKSKEFEERLKCFGDKDYIMLKDLKPEEQKVLFGFDGGDIVGRYQAGNAEFWDGNVDLIKMNLSNPDLSNKEDEKGFYAARKYLRGVATYWTEAIQSDLIKRTAALKDNEIKEIVRKFGIMDDEYKAIKDSIKNGDSISYVLEREKNNDGTEGKYIRSTIDYVNEFPLQSIETSPELSAIFSEPEFQTELLDGKIGRGLISCYVDKVIHNAVPDEYKDNEDYKQFVVKTYSNEILKYLYCKAMLPKAAKSNGTVDIKELRNNLTLNSMLDSIPDTAKEEREMVVNKIKKNIEGIDLSAIENKIAKELKNISLDKFKLAESVVLQTKAGLNWRFDAAKDVGDLSSVKNKHAKFKAIWNGTPQTPGVQQFWNDFITEIKKYHPASYIIAEITDFADFLAWNNLDSMLDYDEELTNTFLTKIKDDIKSSNTSSDELKQCADIFSDTLKSRKERKEAFDKALSIGAENVSENLREYESNLPWAKEQNFLEQIGATTGSNYVQYFNKVSFFVGVDPEASWFSEVGQDQIGHLKTLKEKTEVLLKHTQPNTALLCHTFVENHDKPRTLHTFPLDMNLYLRGLNLNVKWRPGNDLSELDKNDERKDRILKITGRDNILLKITDKNKLEELEKKELKNINPMAAAVGLMMDDKINEAGFLTDEEKEKLRASLRKLVNGEKANSSKPDSRRARAFGFLPYEITTKDLFNGANIKDEDKLEKFDELIMNKPMFLMDKVWQLLTGLVGVPTLYYGADFAQTGYETYAKNELVGNRNRALFERIYNRKDDSIYKKYNAKINAVSALSNNINLSALRNGFPESLEMHTVDGFEMYPIYRKDERNSEVISVLTNFGIEPGVLSKDQKNNFSDIGNEDKISSKKVKNINIKDKNGKCPLDEGTKLKRMVYDPVAKQYMPEDVKYVVKNGSIVRMGEKGVENIKIDDTLSVFYVDKKKSPKFVPVYGGAH